MSRTGKRYILIYIKWLRIRYWKDEVEVSAITTRLPPLHVLIPWPPKKKCRDDNLERNICWQIHSTNIHGMPSKSLMIQPSLFKLSFPLKPRTIHHAHACIYRVSTAVNISKHSELDWNLTEIIEQGWKLNNLWEGYTMRKHDSLWHNL